MDFSYAGGSLFEAFIDREMYDSHKRFGVYTGGNTVETNTWEGGTGSHIF